MVEVDDLLVDTTNHTQPTPTPHTHTQTCCVWSVVLTLQPLPVELELSGMLNYTLWV